MGFVCSTRALKNAKFLQRPDVGFFPPEEPPEGFTSLVPGHVLRRLERMQPEEIGIEQLARAISKKRPPVGAATTVAPLFSGALRFIQTTFSSSGTAYAVPSADLDTAMKHAGLTVGPISAYASQYGPNALMVANGLIPFQASLKGGKYNDRILSEWTDELARAQGLSGNSCIVFLNPQGVVNTDADVTQGVLGYHNVSPSGIPYIFVNMMGQGLTVRDEKEVYALALSHEIAEMTVDPSANGSNPEVCDSCLPPGELILGDNLPIEAYDIGGHVIGVSGLQEVTETFARPFDGQLVEIKALGMLPLRVTPNHPLLVVRGRSRHLEIDYVKPGWIEAGKIQSKIRFRDGDYLVMPRLHGTISDAVVALVPYIEKHRSELKQSGQGSGPDKWPHSTVFPLDSETAWMLGVYVAEGFANHAHGSIEFSLHSDETAIVERLRVIFRRLGDEIWSDPVPGESGIILHVSSVIFCHFMPAVCGSGAYRKRIPDFILYHQDERLLRAFIDGYLRGDGSRKLTTHKYEVSSFSTTSKILAMQLQLALGRLGTFISLRRDRPDREGIILGRRVRMKASYVGSWCSDARATRRKRLHGDSFYLPVKSVRQVPYSGTVHNFETEDHSYLVSNVVTHNCAGNCQVDYRNYFDSGGNWLGGSATPAYAFFIDGIATPASVAQCPSPAASCSYPPPKIH